jgi:glycosyltransferase involved in cell wall biosynthesis
MCADKNADYSYPDFRGEPQQGLVSVVIPTYNRGYILREAIRSVLGQSYGNLEMIVVDDGSTDNTEEVLQGLAGIGDRIRFIKHETNKGEAAATNTGIKNSKGQFITFLDSDDRIFPEKIQSQVREFIVDPDLDACFTAVKEFDGRDEKEWMPFFPPKSFCNSSGLYRREIFKKIGLLDESLDLCSDVEISIRISELCTFKNISAVLMERKRLGDAKSRGNAARGLKYKSYRNIYKKHGNFLIEHFGRKYLSEEFHGWGKYLLGEGKKKEARKCFLKAVLICPWQVRNYRKLLKAVF